MPDSEVRRAETGNRREGRRSHSAYEPQARGSRPHAGVSVDLGAATARAVQPPVERRQRGSTAAYSTVDRRDLGDSSAGIALALIYPFMAGARGKRSAAQRVAPSVQTAGEGTGSMQRKPTIQSLETVSREEAAAYLEYAGGDELKAAYSLACDRNRLDGSIAAPDDPEVHHALFLLCRALGKHPWSFDEMRVELRRRPAA
jgi:hypothetical protein